MGACNKYPCIAFILIGCPIPRVVDGPLAELHWQPLLFNNGKDIGKGLEPTFAESKRKELWTKIEPKGAFALDSQLPWGKSENISRERLYARGQHPTLASQRAIVLVGCGALGSMVAELIVRSGAANVALFDHDKFQMGNQCRHTLDGTEVGRYKAIALAQRLQTCNPLSQVQGYPVAMPLSQGDSNFERELNSVLQHAGLVIDCTANEIAFRWMSRYCHRGRIRLASIYLNFRASVLTVAISGRTTSCADRVANSMRISNLVTRP